MPAPDLIREAVAPEHWGGGSLTHPCDGAKFHSPTPLRTYEYHLNPSSSVWLCGTCEDNLMVYQGLLIQYPDGLEWPLRREFGNQIRALARRVTHG